MSFEIFAGNVAKMEWDEAVRVTCDFLNCAELLKINKDDIGYFLPRLDLLIIRIFEKADTDLKLGWAKDLQKRVKELEK